MKPSEINQTNNNHDFDESYYAYIGSKYVDVLESDLNNSINDISEIAISDNLDDWFKEYNSKIQKELGRKKIINVTKKLSKFVAVFILSITCSLYFFSPQVEGFKLKIMNWVIDDNDSYTNINVEENLSALPPEFKGTVYTLTYLPEGYQFLSINDFNSICLIQYTNGEDIISFGQAPNGTDFQIDTENASKKNLSVDDIKILHVYKDGNVLFWNNQEFSFYLKSNANIDELVKCVTKIKK
jgi:hypothetical protein